ncbi:hypothetical protein F0562_018728 [Nyssa sinensis]|uniref:Ferredoxin thioredoxin reductase alpha chain domain-containing protein n=1 Tax=Nyssa sinensis TaxID=561372 RepID=A0A5J4ZEC9_9ASTE|nr:hypothetical protein F0562_018728 [Nyssa sinensis]
MFINVLEMSHSVTQMFASATPDDNDETRISSSSTVAVLRISLHTCDLPVITTESIPTGVTEREPMTSPAFFSSASLLNRHPRIHFHSLIFSPINVPSAKYSSYVFSLRPRRVDFGAPIRGDFGAPIRGMRGRVMTSYVRASDSAIVVEDPSVASSSSGAAAAAAEEEEVSAAKIGARVRVKVPLKVYHVPRVQEIELTGMEGVLKQYVGVWKGKRISANLPFKIEFVTEIEGRGRVKFFAHLKEDEFEYLA